MVGILIPGGGRIDHIGARHYKLPYNLKVVVHPEVESDYLKQYNNKSL